MASYKVLFRPSKREGKKGSLLIRLIHGRKVKHLTTEFKLFPKEWELLERYLNSPATVDPPIGMERAAAELCAITGHLEVLEEGLKERGMYTVEDLISSYYLCNRGDSLSTFVRNLARNLKSAGQERTARAYLSTLARLNSFARGKDIKFQAINGYFIKAFETELKEEGLMINTISFYLRNLRAIYNKGILSGLVPAHGGSPFRAVRITTQATRKRALTLDQMRQLNNLDFATLLDEDKRPESLKNVLPDSSSPEGEILTKNLYHAWRLFLFSFHARGMSFVDLAYLRKENLRGNSISYYRRKTGGFIEVKVNAEMRSIIESFNDEVKESKYLFPVILPIKRSERIQYESGLRLQNVRLKLLSELAGLKLPLSTHMARHTWATIAKRENLPLGIISEGLGHSDIRTTSIYLDTFERHILDRASDHVSTVIKQKEDASLFY